MDEQTGLSRRERQIMDAVYGRGQATANQVVEGLASPPSRTAVRTLLAILESKGHLRHRKVGREFVYSPTRPRAKAGKSALQRVIETFFDNSLEKAVAAHLAQAKDLDPEELERLAHLIAQARKKGE